MKCRIVYPTHKCMISVCELRPVSSDGESSGWVRFGDVVNLPQAICASDDVALGNLWWQIAFGSRAKEIVRAPTGLIAIGTYERPYLAINTKTVVTRTETPTVLIASWQIGTESPLALATGAVQVRADSAFVSFGRRIDCSTHRRSLASRVRISGRRP